jgi:hypothetical protein
MNTFNNYDKQIDDYVSTQWLNIIKDVPANNNRITDYARPLVDLLILYNPANYSSENNRNIQTYIRQIYTFLHNESFVVRRFSNSNWQAYRLWVMSQINLIVRNRDNTLFLRQSLINYIQESLRVFPQNNPDYGALIDFVHRDSISYQVYTLFGILNTIVILEKDLKITQRNNTVSVLWNADTTLRTYIQPAIDFVLPYLYGTKTYLEYVDSQVSSDKTRSDFGRPFNPQSGNYLYVFMIQNNFI